MSIFRTTELADSILAEIEKIVVENEDEKDYYLEPYQNGREHGYALRADRKKVAFAEYRNTDNLVLYLGCIMDFEPNGNIPSEKVYAKKEFFAPTNLSGAAKRMLEYFGENE